MSHPELPCPPPFPSFRPPPTGIRGMLYGLRRSSGRLFRNFRQKGPWLAVSVVGAATFMYFGAGANVTCNGVGVKNFGQPGQACYPNDTCNKGLTCFRIREKKFCEREVKPVADSGSRSCFEYTTKEGEPHAPCFSSNDECLRSFGRVMQTDATILKGCGFE